MVDKADKKYEIEKERRDFTKLLRKNPNYFGNLEEGPLAESFSAEAEASGKGGYYYYYNKRYTYDDKGSKE